MRQNCKDHARQKQQPACIFTFYCTTSMNSDISPGHINKQPVAKCLCLYTSECQISTDTGTVNDKHQNDRHDPHIFIADQQINKRGEHHKQDQKL